MKVKSLNISKYNQYERLPLTVCKVYDVIDITRIPFSPHRYDDYSGPIYKLINDKGEVSGYSNECVRALTLDEIRELKINELINE